MNIDENRLTADLQAIIPGLKISQLEVGDGLIWIKAPRAASPTEMEAIDTVWDRHLNAGKDGPAIFGLELPGHPHNPHLNRYEHTVDFEVPSGFLQCNDGVEPEPLAVDPAVILWLEEHARGRYLIQSDLISFEKENEALLFKLRWC